MVIAVLLVAVGVNPFAIAVVLLVLPLRVMLLELDIAFLQRDRGFERCLGGLRAPMDACFTLFGMFDATLGTIAD